MPQIRVTTKTKKLLDKEYQKQKKKAKELGDPVPSMAAIAEVLILEGKAK